MVRLKAPVPASPAKSKSYFNSKMVRLKEKGSEMEIEIKSNFNSKMVRLKVMANVKATRQSIISIPKWFD